MIPLISIIVASYNYEKFITETLDSILAQTFTNWEALVVDDGSQDNSLDVIKKFAEKDTRIKLYQHPDHANRGLSASLKLALLNAKGEWIAFCESDDWWEDDFLESLVNESKRNPKKNLIFSDVILEGESASMKEHCSMVRTHFRNGGTAIELFQRMINAVPTFSCAMVKTELLKKCNFSSRFPPSLDMWLWAQISSYTDFSFVDKPLSHWRQHQTSYMKKSVESDVLDMNIVNEFHCEIRKIVGSPRTESLDSGKQPHKRLQLRFKLKKLRSLLLFVLLFLLIYSVNQYASIYSDDYDVVIMACDNEGKYSFLDQLQNLYAYYLNSGSRVFAFFFAGAFLSIFGIKVTYIIQSLILSLLFFVGFKLVKKIIPACSNILVWSIILGGYFSIKIEMAREGIYYFAASSHYIWSLLPLCSYILLSEYASIDKFKKKLWNLGLFALLFLSVCSNEVVALASFAYVVSVSFMNFGINPCKRKFYLISCLISLTGVIFIFCSPGSANRSKAEHVDSFSQIASFENFIATWSSFQRVVMDYLCLGTTVLLLFSLVGMINLFIKNKPLFKRILPLFILLVASLIPTLHPSARTPRVYSSFFVFCPIFIAIIISYFYEVFFIKRTITQTRRKVILSFISFVVVLFLVCPILNFAKLYRNYKKNYPIEVLNDNLLSSEGLEKYRYIPFFINYKAFYGCQHGNTIRSIYEECVRKYYHLPNIPFVYFQIPKSLYFEAMGSSSKGIFPVPTTLENPILHNLLIQPTDANSEDLIRNKTIVSLATSGCRLSENRDSGDVQIIAENEDPQIIIPYKNENNYSTFCIYLDFTIETNLDCVQIFYQTEKEATYDADRVVTSDRSIVKGNNKLLLVISDPDKPCNFRFDPGIHKGKYIIHSFKIIPFPLFDK